MAKKLKKLNQPKKYLQGGSNLGSVSQSRQNPYYIGQVGAQSAEEQFANSQADLAATYQNALQLKKDTKAANKEALDQSIQNGAKTLAEAAAADKKAGILGKLFTKNPVTPVAGVNAMQEVSSNAVNPINYSWAPTTVAPVSSVTGTTVSSAVEPATQMVVGQAAPTISTGNAVMQSANVADTGAQAAQVGAGLSNLATAGIGVGANIAGTIIKKRANDNDAYTFTDKERRGNTAGSMLASAGTGFGIGNLLLPGVGGAIGAGIGAGIGAIKAHKENQAAETEAERLQRELAAQRGAFQSSFVNSRLTGVDTGFGLNSSTNMNNQFTSQYQVAKTGGVTSIQEDRRPKKVPGGKIVPIEGTDAVEFVGRSHENGGIRVDSKTEVEGGETQDQVVMNNNNKQDYIFSKYLKLGGKSFAQRHKEILAAGGDQSAIQALAQKQEEMAGRNPSQVARYGGVHKYLNGGVQCPDCPEGTVCDPATGTCVPEETGASSGTTWTAPQIQTTAQSTEPVIPMVRKEASLPIASNLLPAAYTKAPVTVQPQQVVTQPVVQNTTQTQQEPTVTYTTSDQAPVTTADTKPRYFMGATRKVDDAGNVTIYKDKPLMGVGAMSGSRLGTQGAEGLDKVLSNPYDAAWANKADNLYTQQKGAGSGSLSYSDYVGDRDKIAESNWGQKYGYRKGMTAEEAKAAHGKFEADVHSLFAKNPDEMLGYFQYIIDGGDPNSKGYLGKDAEQIRANLTKKGFIGADGRPVAGKEKEMASYLETQATNSAVGPIHNALGSYTAERDINRLKLEDKKVETPEKPATPLADKYQECPPGTYRSTDGSCKPLGNMPQEGKVTSTLLAGLGQLVPAGAVLMNPYKIAPGIMGAPAVKGALMPRMNLNQERAEAIQSNVAVKNAVLNQNAGPGALVAMQAANNNVNQQMLKIAKQEQDTNKQLAAQEAENSMKASMFNAENDMKRQMFNTEFNQKERQYRREEILGALNTTAARIAGIVKDERAYQAQERLAKALDETGSYDRFNILEQLSKEAKRKGSPYYGTSEAELRRMANAMSKQINPDYEAKTAAEKPEESSKKKFGGARQYVSRLGQLSEVRSTKVKL